MPRGDKPTTTALALKDGWVYEDALPSSITKEQYDWWLKESLVLDGVRMGPPMTTTKPQSTTELGIDTNFPLSETLRLLVEWAKHLHDSHECDCDGWEQRSFLIEAAQRYQVEITQASAPASAAPVVDEVIESAITNASGLSNRGRFEEAFNVLVNALRSFGSHGTARNIAATAAPQDNPWLKLIGKYKNDPTWREFGAFLEEHRAEVDRLYAESLAAPVEQQTFKNTKEAMLYAQRNNIPAVVPVEQSSELDEATMEWALRELADGWIQNNEREGPHGFYQTARRVLNAIANRAQ